MSESFAEVVARVRRTLGASLGGDLSDAGFPYDAVREEAGHCAFYAVMTARTLGYPVGDEAGAARLAYYEGLLMGAAWERSRHAEREARS